MLFGQTATPPAAGDGSIGTPYQITTLENLYWIAASDGVVSSPNQATRWAAYYIQTADIDALATAGGDWGADGWTPIGNSSSESFTGSYNGQGYSIDRLTISRGSTNYIGLFGYTIGATIQNLGVTSVSITGQQSVGSIVGYNYSTTINNCYATGNLSGDMTCGGLIGNNIFNSSVNRCFANVDIQANAVAGGFIGNNSSSTIINCYSLGNVQCRQEGVQEPTLGGFCGNHGITSDSRIEYCYSIGMVSYLLADDPTNKGFVGSNNSGGYTANFWDTESSGQSSTGSTSFATGKTTTEMKTQSTFLDAGWSSAIWNIGDGINDDYPYLDWQNPSGTPLPVELTSVTASTSENKVTLNWQTTTEVNNYGFEIERCVAQISNLCHNWETIGFVEGHGNSNSPKDYSFVDSKTSEVFKNLGGFDGELQYRLKQIDFDGNYKYSDVVEVTLTENIKAYKLHQNYPNPFNPTTRIDYQLPFNSELKIELYSITGERVATLVNQPQEAGYYTIEVNTSKLCLASGVYFYRMIVQSNLTKNEFIQVRKLLVMK